MGGLSRRAYILNKIRQEESKPVLALDAGAMLFPEPFIAPSLLPPKSVQAAGLIEAMAQMQYDAFGLAPQDLTAGTSFLLEQPANVQLPWLSMNIAKKNGKKLLFAPYIIKKVGDLSIAILGITGFPKTKANQEAPVDYQILNWEKSLENSLSQIKSQADMIILLSSLPDRTNQQISEKFKNIHLIIQSGLPASRRPQLFSNTLITQVSSKGKYIGRLDIDWKTSHKWEQSATTEFKPIRDQLDRINWQIGRLEKRFAPDEIGQNEQHKQLLLEKSRLMSELKKLEEQNQNGQEHLSTYKNTFIELPVSMQEDPEIQQIIMQTKIAVNKANQNEMAKNNGVKAQTSLQIFSNMAGWQACQSCHKQQTAFWQQTDHAKAWQTLVDRKQQFNPECVICHVTLPTYDQETVTGQNLLAGLKEEFKTIGCETCHGPAKKHSQEPDRHRPLKPNLQICLNCHTPERDNNFVYSEKLKKIRCPASGH